MHQKKTGSRNKQKKLVIIVCLFFIAAAATGIILRVVHIRQLRVEMEYHLADTVANIELGSYNKAYEDADEAMGLAIRLRDDEMIELLELYIRFIEAAIYGDASFDLNDFHDALESYNLAYEYAISINDLNTEQLDLRITKTKMFIAFYDLVESAQHKVIETDYEEAISFYEEAYTIAAALTFTEGANLAQSGIEDAKILIIEAKRDEAMNLFIKGDQLYSERQYAQALEYFHNALEIYLELDDSWHVLLIHDRINHSERLLAESQQPESDLQEPSEDEITDDPDDSGDQVESTMNYEHNISVNFDLRTLIDNQNRSPANQVRMGTRDGLNEGWYNGCGWIATYNSLLILGDPRHPAEIIRYFEASGGTVFGGVFGTYPNSIESYLNSLGFNANHTIFPQLSMDIDEAIKASRVCILAYVHTNAAHYVTVEYKEDIDRFVIYNDSLAKAMSAASGFQNDVSIGAAIDSVIAFINSTPTILFSFSLITIE